MFATFKGWIPRTSSWAYGFEGLVLFVWLSVTTCYRWAGCLHLGTGGKVEIGCWSPDRTLRDAMRVWCSGPKTIVWWLQIPDQSSVWWVFSGREGRVVGASFGPLVPAWPGFKSGLAYHHLCDFRKQLNFSEPWNTGGISKIMYIESLAHSKTKC